MRLSSNFRNPCMIRSDAPLTNDEIARVAPSIFAEEAHDSRSERYLYIPTVKVLDALRTEGFQPFMACQTRIAQPRFVVIVPGFGGDRKHPRQKWPTVLHLAGVKLVRVEQKRHAIPRDEQAMPRVGLE